MIAVNDMSNSTSKDTLDVLSGVFANYGPDRTRLMYGEQPDLFLSSANIAIQCKKHGCEHCETKEDVRHRAWITKKTGCSWVSYNPNSIGFSMDALIDEIQLLLDNQTQKESPRQE